ncbi:MAG: cell surface protein SprA [candidate division Zixibacteria bacterium]|nr:cell surface protein SprA [candidate division Zixibacteria bacterium]
MWWLAASTAHGAPGISYSPEENAPESSLFSAPHKDTTVSFNVGPLIRAPQKPPPNDLSPWTLNLGPLGPKHADSLDLQTYIAFRNQQTVVGGWNNGISTLLKQTDRQKRGELKIGLALPSAMQSIVGEGGAGLQVSGSQKILFSGRSQFSDAASVSSVHQSKFPSLKMEQQSQFKIQGTVGSKITVSVDQDSRRTTDLQNRIIIRYKGDEDDIIQSLDLGNTTLSLTDSRFIGYSEQIQGLFGIGAAGKLGPVDFKLIASQEKGNTTRNRLTAGANQQDIYIRDYNFDRYRFFDLGLINGDTLLQPGDTIVEFQFFQSTGSYDQLNAQSVAYADWLNRGTSPDSLVLNFRPLKFTPPEYNFDPGKFYVWFPTHLQNVQTSVLAYYMRVRKKDGAELVFGHIPSTGEAGTYQLQMLKRALPHPGDGLWDAEWKNVYDLRVRNINYQDLSLDIYKGLAGDEVNAANLDHQNGVYYLQLLGLDSIGATGVPPPDNKIDDKTSILDVDNGLLIFPSRHPFDLPKLDSRVTNLYAGSDQYWKDSTQYYIKLTTRQRSKQLRLGAIDILDGSEVVTFNGQRLNRGTDYDIDYGQGTITFTRDDVLDPNANVTIDYEYAPFLSAEKRNLFGFSTRYVRGANFRTGNTLLYKGTKATDRPAQLGQEPFRDMVGEQFLNWSFESGLLTRMANALPLVKTDARSLIDMSAAVARSLPNPNTKGDVRIDDFEGTKRAQSLGVLRETWTIASPPLNHDGDTLHTRGLYDSALIWFDPYTAFDETDIYERNPANTNSQQRRTPVLVMEFRPEKSATRKAGAPIEDAWGGIMRALPVSSWDQSRAEFIELRMAVATKTGQPRGTLHLDLGRVSEDVNGDGVFNTEDKLRGTPGYRNKALDADEDVGLDGIPDLQERADSADTTTDPHGDDWAYDNSPAQQNNYDHINGTENNRSDPVRGRYPDTEDLGGESVFDQKNSYYEFSFKLGDPLDPSLVDSTQKKSGDVTGFADNLVWQTYRVPLWRTADYDSFGDAGTHPSPAEILYSRLWLSGADATTRVYIAAADLVQRTWTASLIPGPPDLGHRGKDYPTPMSVSSHDASFSLGVVNTEENFSTYTPPPGVSGVVDPRTQIQEKEQSLLLKYGNFRVGDSGRVNITVAKEDYTGYRSLHMFVHADAPSDRKMEMSFRFGQNSNNYYEYRDMLVYSANSDSNWNANAIAIDFNQLTALKDTSVAGTGGNYAVFDSIAKIGVYGKPSLSNVIYREIRLTRIDHDPNTISGEIWCDELQLNDVRKDPGLAASGKLTVQMADLVGFTATIEDQNYAFRQLNQGRSSSVQAGSDRLTKTWNGNLALHKFTPPSLGLGLPISVNYSKAVSTPRLLTGSDVVLPPKRQEEQKSTSISEGFSIPFTLRPKTTNWLVNATVGSFSTRFSASRSQSWTPTTPYSINEVYNAGADYNLKFKQRLSFPALFWTRYFLLPKRVHDTRFSLLPTGFDAHGTVNRNRSSQRNSLGLVTDAYTRNFQGNAGVDLLPFPGLSVTYDMATQRDLSDPTSLQFSLDPQKFRLGDELSYTQKISSNYRPVLFSFLTPALTYSGNFGDKIDRTYGNHSVNGDRSWSASGSFDLARFWTALGAAPSKTKAKPSGTPGQPAGTKPKPAASAESLFGPPTPGGGPPPSQTGGLGPLGIWRGFMGGLRWLTSPIQPATVSYARAASDTRKDLISRPSKMYQFGFDFGNVPPKTTGTTNSSYAQVDARTDRENFSVKNQVSFFKLLTFGTGYTFNSTVTNRAGSLSSTTKGTIFPSLTTSLDRIERFKPLGWIFSNASARFSYEKKNDKAFQADTLTASNTSVNYTPLVSISGTTLKGLRTTISVDRTSAASAPQSSLKTKRSTGSVRVTGDYSFSSPNGIPLPLLHGIRLHSQMSLSVAVTRKSSNAATAQQGGSGYNPTQNSTDLSVTVQVGYSFSSRMRGGMNAEWSDHSETLPTPQKSHVRALGIWAEFSF